MNIKDEGVKHMEQVCTICGSNQEEQTAVEEQKVIVFCDNCLKSDQIFPVLDQIFLP
jgi:hypothetical protein